VTQLGTTPRNARAAVGALTSLQLMRDVQVLMATTNGEWQVVIVWGFMGHRKVTASHRSVAEAVLRAADAFLVESVRA
jgi:hypothetical protein